MLDLDRGECLRLLAESRFGRIAVATSEGTPVIRPVNYAFDANSQSVVFRTALGSKFHALLVAEKAAFEIDGIDAASRTGWSVIASGVTEEIVDSAEIERLQSIGVDPWAPDFKHHWVRIRAFTVSGRRIALQSDALPGYRV
jgi:nitroimidazol reductase NimA-like FMN-containing flavoprotein (pyridoxamine 5'-phosphate oxidase superfamily)